MPTFGRFLSLSMLISAIACATLGNADDRLSDTAKQINKIAINALDEKNFSDKNGITKLYGTRTNGPDTKGGQWACAKVVSIILKQSGLIKRLYLGVGKVEAVLSKWKKIKSEDDLMPGDVIVWVSKSKGRDDKKCTGGGNCHIGIVTEKGYFHNSPISKTPTFDGISLLGFEFKVGYRPPP